MSVKERAKRIVDLCFKRTAGEFNIEREWELNTLLLQNANAYVQMIRTEGGQSLVTEMEKSLNKHIQMVWKLSEDVEKNKNQILYHKARGDEIEGILNTIANMLGQKKPLENERIRLFRQRQEIKEYARTTE